MKSLLLGTAMLLTTISGFAQGVVQLGNFFPPGPFRTHMYAPLAAAPYFSQIGNGANDLPAGTTDWANFTPIGANGLYGQYGGATTYAQLLGAPGFNAPESSLLPASPITTFHTGAGAGILVTTVATLPNVLPDAPAATVELVVWDNSTGLYPTWAEASVGWSSGWIAAGKSGPLNVSAIGGPINPPPYLTGLQSFNLYLLRVPEPSLFALAGLGVAALIVARRHK